MAKVLLLRLEGPLQSWGGRSRWDVRDTEAEPTKSGVIGLLGCALGYGIGDRRLETELDAGLLFGVRVERAGRRVRDYQTIAGFLPTADGRYKHTGVKTSTNLRALQDDPDVEPATVQSPRFYLEDAAFLVGLAGREANSAADALLDRCAAAMRDPQWPLYLGRKACVPTRPIMEEVTDRYESLEAALRQHPWSWLGGGARERRSRDSRNPTRPVAEERLVAYLEDPAGELVRQDAVRINRARQYDFRSMRALDGPAPPRREDSPQCSS